MVFGVRCLVFCVCLRERSLSIDERVGPTPAPRAYLGSKMDSSSPVSSSCLTIQGFWYDKHSFIYQSHHHKHHHHKRHSACFPPQKYIHIHICHHHHTHPLTHARAWARRSPRGGRAAAGPRHTLRGTIPLLLLQHPTTLPLLPSTPWPVADASGPTPRQPAAAAAGARRRRARGGRRGQHRRMTRRRRRRLGGPGQRAPRAGRAWMKMAPVAFWLSGSGWWDCGVDVTYAYVCG